MPQSTKDSRGGKTHSNKKSHSAGPASRPEAGKSSGRSASSPTGSMRKGEKKTTPH